MMAKFSWEIDRLGELNIDGARLEAICFGPPPGEANTIVLLHEGLGCLALWRDFPQRLAERTGFGVFVYSRAGYGNSDAAPLPRPLDYMSSEALDVLPRVLDIVGVERCILLGHSHSATIAAIYGGSAEDFRVRGLILMAPHFFTEEQGLTAIADAKSAYENGGLRDKLAKYHDNPDVAFCGWNNAWLDPDFRSWNVAEVIDYLRIPVLAIQGANDDYGTLAQIEEIKNRIYSPLDVEVLQDCGHAPHLEQPERTLAVVQEFTIRLDRIENENVEIR